MNLQVELRKMIDWINSQSTVIKLILWFAVIIFVIIPFALPAAIIYLIWTILKGKDQTK